MITCERLVLDHLLLHHMFGMYGKGHVSFVEIGKHDSLIKRTAAYAMGKIKRMPLKELEAKLGYRMKKQRVTKKGWQAYSRKVINLLNIYNI